MSTAGFSSRLQQSLRQAGQPLLLALVFALVYFFFLFFFYQDYQGGAFKPAWRSFIPVFHSRSIITGFFTQPLLVAAIALVYLLLVWARVSFTYGTSQARLVRLLVFVPACLLTWETVTYDTNFYLGSGFTTDRILLLALALCIWRYPVLVPFYLAYLLVYRSQFNYPLGGFMLIDKRIFIEYLVLFMAWCFSARFFGAQAKHFLLLVFCIPAAHYFYSGLAKIFISPHGYEWVLQNNLNDLFFNAYGRGWGRHLDQGSLDALHGFFDSWGTFLQCCTLLTELGMVLFLWRRRLGIVLLVCCLLMHTAIFLAGSIFFWKWMSIDLLLLVVLLKPHFFASSEVFSRLHFRLSVLLIAGAFAWLRPAFIAWHDTPFNQFFTFEAVDETGQAHILSRNDFNPFHQFFQLDRFHWLVKKPLLPVTGFGYTQRYALAREIRQAGPQKLAALETRFGRLYYNQQNRDAFVYFIKTFFRHRPVGLHNWWYRLRAPYHLYSTAAGAQPFTGRIVQVRVYLEQTWRQGSRLLHIHKKTCEIIDIPR